ncbi:MAG: hypothetical protein JJE52_09215 [Acidimicrobiia bacterium]|nr:hypothetical protein [Acidimicrobiia bacterium]
MTHPIRVRLTALAGLLAAAALLSAAGQTLPAPPTEPLAVLDWWASTDPALALGVILHAIAMIVCGYLLVVTALELIGSIIGIRPLTALARRLAPVAWRTMALRPVTLGTLAVPTMFAPVLTASPAMAQPAPVDTAASDSTDERADAPVVVTMSRRSTSRIADPATTSPHPGVGPHHEAIQQQSVATSGPTTTSSARAPAQSESAQAVDTGLVAATLTFLGTPSPSPERAAVAPTHTTATSSIALHRTMPGDTLWRIADEHLGASLGRPPSSRETGAYVHELVVANHDRLPSPDNPDLIYPGIELMLPAVR